jgi:high-affinity Fe2+/Pb2+ permease
VAALLYTGLGGYGNTLLVLIGVAAVSTVVFVLSTRVSRDGPAATIQ